MARVAHPPLNEPVDSTAGDPAAVDPTAKDHWNTRYSDAARIWSGRANAALVAEVAELPPGTALELGSGEGADAIHLASLGWQVTALDVSDVALERAAAAAADAGVDERIQWMVADLAEWVPTESFDLVVACFLHSRMPDFPRERILRRAVEAVAPHGRIVVVSHAEPPPWSKLAHGHGSHGGAPGQELPSLQQELDTLGLEQGWSIETAEVRERAATGPDGTAATLLDIVIRAQRH